MKRTLKRIGFIFLFMACGYLFILLGNYLVLKFPLTSLIVLGCGVIYILWDISKSAIP